VRRPSGVDEQFEQFVVEFTPTLLRGAYFLLRDMSLAEDAVQTTMLRTSQRWQAASAAPQAYSRQVLINVCREHWRRQRHRPQETGLSDDLLDHHAAPFTEQVQERNALERALGELTSPQREVLVLRFFFDLSVEQTATLLKIAPGTVKSATHRGLQQLRHLLAPSDAKESYVD
jgi:RNA polymerase sigma-70 factor (sigma-E family)